jgi:hypothetical protein
MPILIFLFSVTCCRVENSLTHPHKETTFTAVQVFSIFELLHFYNNMKQIFERKNEIMNVIT